MKRFVNSVCLSVIGVLLAMPLYAATEEVMVGSIPGELSATPMGGAAYSIPIDCPHGVGVQPTLSLVYNSQSGRGIAGWGWNLSGLSAIVRVPTNGYWDEKNASVKWTKEDALSLNGKRLVIERSWGTDSIEYRQENDPSIMVRGYNIQSWGPSYLKAYTKEGLTMTYGNPEVSSSYIIPDEELLLNLTTSYRMGWNLVEVSDANGNYMKVDYMAMFSFGGGSMSRPALCESTIGRITYGGNKRKGSAGNVEVLFEYETRPDEQTSYVFGKRFRQWLRLKAIKTNVSSENQKEYRLSYDASSVVSRLQSVTLYDSENRKLLDPLTFKYGQSNPDRGDQSIPAVYRYNNGSGNLKNKQSLVAVDLDGDGKCELGDIYSEMEYDPLIGNTEYSYFDVRRKTDAWYTKNRFSLGYLNQYFKSDSYNILTDLNCDGTSERILLYFGGRKEMNLQVINAVNNSVLSSPETITLFNGTEVPSFTSPFICAGNIKGSALGNLIVIMEEPDENNGRHNYFYQVLSASENGKVSLDGTVKSFSLPSKLEKAFLVNFNSVNYFDDLVLILEDQSVYMMVNSDDSNSHRVTSTSLHFSGSAPFRFGDLNGDGLVDILYRENGNQWKIAYNKGNHGFDIIDLGTPGSMPCNAFTALDEPNLMKYEEKDDVFLLDINQDGLMDIVFADENLKKELPSHPSYSTYVFKETFWSFYLNTGNGFTKYLSEYSSEPSSYACFGDMQGKGDINWVHAKVTGNMVITTFDFPRNPSLLTGIVNPVSGETALEYKPHIECEQGSADRYTLRNYLDMQCMPFKSSLFKVFSGSNDGLTQLSYRYGMPVVNWRYHGFLGFRMIGKLDVKKNLWEVTELTFPDQGKPYFLMLPLYKKAYGKKGGQPFLIRIEEYTYAIKSYKDFYGKATKRYAVNLASHLSTGKLAGEASVRNEYISYDEYGNLLESGTQTLKQTEYNKFNYRKQAAWCPNKPIRSEKNIAYEGEESSLLHITNYLYDLRGNPVEIKTDSGDVNALTIRYKNYDYYGHPLLIEEEANGVVRSSSCTYTESGRFVSSKKDPLNQTVSYTWDEKKGLLMKSTDRIGNTSYVYDRFGQITSITYPTGMVETQSLQWVANDPVFKYCTVQSRPDLPGKSIWTYYDKYGREVAKDTYSTEKNNRKTRIVTEYNSTTGKPYRVSLPGYTGSTVKWASTLYYDTFGRISSSTTPEGSTTVNYRLNTDQCEDSMVVKTPNGMTTITVWNAEGQISEVITNGKSVRYTYTAGNKQKTAKPDGNNFTVQMEYDLQGNLTRQTDPDMGSIQYNYDGFGQLKWEKQSVRYSGNLVTTEYDYTPGGLLRTKTRGSEITTYSYDAYQRLKTVTLSNRIHIRNLEYDTYDRLTKISDQIKGRSYVTQKNYDEYGRVKTETYPTGYAVTNSYDSYGYLKSVTDNSSRLIWRLDSCDAEGKVLKETKGSAATRYTYDAAGRVLSIQAPGIINSHYTYYTTGNLKTYTDSISNQMETYTYDAMDRLLTWKKPEEVYPYASVGYDNTRANRIASKNDRPWGSVLSGYYSYSSTSSSNALKEVSLCTSPAQNITYTDFKKVTYLSQAGGYESFTINYGVDEERVYMKENHRYGVERYYVGNYAEEIGYGGNTTGIHYIYGGNGIAAVYKSTGSSSGMLYSAYTDRQGSLVALVNDNKVVGRYAYDPWGNRRNPSNWLQKFDAFGTLIVNRGYTMHEHLDAFGLINMNGRMYDPLSSTFLSPDPYIQSPGNWFNYNRYAYCMNNPLRYMDSSGEFWEFVVGGILIGAYIGASIEGGSFNPGKWSGCWWQGAIWGGMIGAATGGVIGAMWEAGASISIGFQAYGLKPITLLSFSPASASAGGITTLSIGGGLGLGSGISVPLGKKKERKDITPFDVGMEWLTGEGPRDRTFYDGDYFTELLKEHSHIDETREIIRDRLRVGNLEEGSNRYDLQGIKGVGLYLKDYSTLMTGGLTGNLAVTYLGSYSLQYKILSSERNSAIVQFTVSNNSTAASAFRPPAIGYAKYWKDNVEPLINNFFSKGPMSQKSQTFIWKERIRW